MLIKTFIPRLYLECTYFNVYFKLCFPEHDDNFFEPKPINGRTTHIMHQIAPSPIARLLAFVTVASLKITEQEHSRFPKTELLIKYSSPASMSRNIADALYQ
jgi:hypothetical protein